MYGKLSGAFEVKKLSKEDCGNYGEWNLGPSSSESYERAFRGNEASDNSRTHSNYPFCVKGRPERDYETVGR